MIRTRLHSASVLAASAMAILFLAPATAGVVFSESFEAPVVTGFADNTVPSGGKWIGASQGFGATNRGLYNETFAWPATAAFTTPYGYQAYYLELQQLRPHHLRGCHRPDADGGRHLQGDLQRRRDRRHRQRQLSGGTRRLRRGR